jgi:hypothetical protein
MNRLFILISTILLFFIVACSQGASYNIVISSDNGNSAPVDIYSTFSAIQYSSNGESIDLTRLGKWSSSNESVAIFNPISTNNLLAKSVGNTTVGFTYNNRSSYLLFSVVNSTLQSISVAFESDSYSYKNLYVGLNAQLKATGFYSDKSKKDLTETVQWSSNNQSVATIYNSESDISKKGIITPLLESSSVIFTAKYESIESSITLTVSKGLKIFVTESKFTGNLGGFDGADDKCNQDESRPNLQARYSAMLLGNNATKIGISYYNVAESILAKATTTNLVADITKIGILENIINSAGIDVEKNAQCWTGLYNANNGNFLKYDCQGWTGSGSGGYGINNVTTESWFSYRGTQSCSNPKDASLHLYCVEQPE